ncbi:MAG: zinc ribbon domain-containing protein [Ruminiclostridium sp.]|nr:zinc ribbon domain-containing protein [Ruminiclostridium sp.]
MRHFTKRLTAVAALLALLFALCSCVDMEMGIIINSDGSARAYTEIAVQKSLLEMAGKTEEEFFEQVDESSGSSNLKDWKTEKYSKTIDGDTYTGVRYYKDGSADVLASEGLSGGNNDGEKISFERKGSTLLITVIYEGDAAEPSGELENYLSQNMMNVTFRIQAPFKILETNGTIDEDGSVYWNMLDVMTGKTDRLEMTVSYDAGMDLGTILLIVLGALVILIVVIVLLRKRPKPLTANTSYAQSTIPTETTAPTSPTVPVEAAMTAAAPETPAAPATGETEEPAETPEPEAETKKFCSNCGTQIKTDDAFCPNCGAKIQ